MHVIAAKAVCFKEALTPSFKTYTKQVIDNAKILSETLVKNNFKLPYPLMNVINGGVHANNGLRIQEFMIRPDKAKSITESIRICFLVINKLKNIIKQRRESTSVGDEGGFAPMINDNEEALTDELNAELIKLGLY